MLRKTFQTTDNPINLFIRLMVGLVFLSEGIQKFMLPELVGSGRFHKIGIPNPEFMGYFVGINEIIFGILILFGLFTRLAALPLIMVILNAIYFTKIPTLLEKGFWVMAHQSRTDFCMLMGLIILFIFGGGKWSLDRELFNE
jgi:uncharacterized membrane protein YphA (DoxX/SURF4 family)